MNKDEREMLIAFKQLSASGRLDVMAHTQTVLKAENGIKKQYGLDVGQSRKAVPSKKRKVTA